jgi:hypothetical protein
MKTLALATGMLLLAATVGVAAGEPVPLIDRQLDAVNAGQFASISILVSASGGTPGTAVTSATATASAQTTSTSATATANGNAMDSVTGSVELLP